MSKLKAFLVMFDKPYAVYYAGEQVTGYVIVNLADEMKMRGIRLQFKGRAKVHWTLRRSKKTYYYRAEEVYFDQTNYLIGDPKTGDVKLGPGEFKYPFQLSLPSSLPSSFEGVHGSVRYYIEATIDKPWKFDHVTKTAFTVLSILDLNYEPQTVKIPRQLQEQKESSSLCFKYGAVDVSWQLSKTCFVPGETIFINATITNDSKKPISGSKVVLKQYTEFVGALHGFQANVIGVPRNTSKTVTHEVLCVSKSNELVAPNSTYLWSNVPLVLPSLPPSRLVGCNAINISYKLGFYLIGSNASIKLKTEIIIGTIPLHVGNKYHGGGEFINQPSAPPAIEISDVNLMPAPPPPSYEECILGKVSIKEEDDSNYVQGNLSWAPMYPVYHGYIEQQQQK